MFFNFIKFFGLSNTTDTVDTCIAASPSLKDLVNEIEKRYSLQLAEGDDEEDMKSIVTLEEVTDNQRQNTECEDDEIVRLN